MTQDNETRNREKLAEAARTVQNARTGIILTGRIVNGKVELDQSVLDEIAKKYAGATKSFIAVNAPFDPVSAVVEH